MNAPPASLPPSRPRRGGALAWALLAMVAVLALGACAAWRWNAIRVADAQAVAAERLRVEALEQRMDALRRDQRAQTARLQQAEATNRLLREELIGLGQRAALLDETVQKLADPATDAGQSLRLDEVELLLAQGQQRLLLSGDLDGARRAYALAAQLLDGIVDHARLDLRQALAQERAALDALGEDPGVAAARRLDAFAAALPALPQRSAPAAGEAAWWDRLLSRLVQVRPSGEAQALAPDERVAGLAALQLELALARAAIERRDVQAWRAALARADEWVLRLWPESAGRAARRGDLRALQAHPLSPQVPALGSTLGQLRRLRQA
ncbi:uroporphyrinogen-III C-methyltransferase [Luteimonas composti]